MTCVRRNEAIVPLFKVIEDDPNIGRMVVDYSISQTTLEEVFLNVRLQAASYVASFPGRVFSIVTLGRKQDMVSIAWVIVHMHN